MTTCLPLLYELGIKKRWWSSGPRRSCQTHLVLCSRRYQGSPSSLRSTGNLFPSGPKTIWTSTGSDPVCSTSLRSRVRISPAALFFSFDSSFFVHPLSFDLFLLVCFFCFECTAHSALLRYSVRRRACTWSYSPALLCQVVHEMLKKAAMV